MPTSAELLNSLYSQYTSIKSRPVRTDEQRRQQAENEYKSYYDALRLAAQQGYDSTDLKLQQQLSGLQQSYDQQRKNTAEQYAKSYSQADRQMLSRGMQRSTYTSQLLAGINNEAAEAQGEIDAAQTKATNDLNDQRTQLAAQLAAQMNQYTASQQSDILKRIAELEEQDRQYSLSEASMQSSLGGTLYAMLKEKEDADAAAAAAAKKPSGGVYTPPIPTDNDVGDDKYGAMSWEKLRARLEDARQRAVAAAEEKNKQIATENKGATGALRTKYMAKKETK